MVTVKPLVQIVRRVQRYQVRVGANNAQNMTVYLMCQVMIRLDRVNSEMTQ